MDKKIFAVIPAYNEENTIQNVLNGLKEYVNNIIVIDDASNDLTGSIAQKEGAIIITHQQNQGYDESLNDGFKKASELGADIIFSFDADNQHDPKDIPKLINPLIENLADISIGIRPKYARITEKFFAFISKRKTKIEDPFCGFKAYKIEVYENIGFFDNIQSIGTQLMLEAVKRGYKVISVKINLNDRSDKPRFGTKFKGNIRILKAILKIYYKIWL